MDLFDYIVCCVRIRILDFVNYVNCMVENITDKHKQEEPLNISSPLNMTLGIYDKFQSVIVGLVPTALKSISNCPQTDVKLYPTVKPGLQLQACSCVHLFSAVVLFANLCVAVALVCL